MNTGSIRPVTRPGTSSNLPDGRQQGGQPASQSVAELLSQALEEERRFQIGKEPEQPLKEELLEEEKELEKFLLLVEESNRQIYEAAKRWEPYKPKMRAVPSVLGLNVNSASAKLQSADLAVAKVSQEYSDKVPAGHIVTQIPGPGGVSSDKAGVKIVISKGPPPEKEKYDRVKKREDLPTLRIKSKREQQEEQDARLRLSGVVLPTPSAGDGGLILIDINGVVIL